MVLYSIQHSAGIIRAIVHKYKYHPQDDAVFIVDKDVSSPYCPVIDKIKYYRMPDPWEIARYSAGSKEELKKYVNRRIADFFSEADIDPFGFSHIYVLFDRYNPFILYFEMNSVKYMAVEFVESIFDTFANDADFGSDKDTYLYDCLIKDMHLQDACGKNCTKGYLYSDKSVTEAIKGKVPLEVFGFYESLVGLDEEYKRRIIKGYNAERFDYDAVMLLNSPLFTNRTFEMNRLRMPAKYTREDPNGGVYYFYKTLIDYYFSDVDFALKVHPESDENFVKAFSAFRQLPKELPVEVFFLFGNRFDVICPVDSVSNEIFQKYDFNVKNLGVTIFNFFKQIHFVFLSSTLINAICVPDKINVFGIEPLQLNNFKKFVFREFQDVEFERLNRSSVRNAVFIIADPYGDCMEIIKDAPTDCLIFLNGSVSADDRIFAKQEMVCSVIDVSDDDRDELLKSCWTVLSKNREFLDAVKGFSVSYTLENAQVMIQSSPHN